MYFFGLMFFCFETKKSKGKQQSPPHRPWKGTLIKPLFFNKTALPCSYFYIVPSAIIIFYNLTQLVFFTKIVWYINLLLIYLFIYPILSIYLCIYLSIYYYAHICLSIYLSTHWSRYQHNLQLISQHVRLSANQSPYQSV